MAARPLSGEARMFTWFAVILWAITMTAAIDMALGNPTAINAVVGCGPCALLAAAIAATFRRQDRRRPQGR